jgi:hypothetical protein
MPPGDRRRSLEVVAGEKEVGVVWRSLLSGVVVLGGVAVAFVAVALTLALHS